jgi:hypothetical protein
LAAQAEKPWLRTNRGFFFLGENGMAPFLFRCPNTGYRVQGFVAEDASDGADDYQAIACLACQRVHLVNPTTGKVLGADDE